MAESDFYDPSHLYFSIYERKEDGEITYTVKRTRIELPEDEMVSPRPTNEESRARRDTHMHSRAGAEFPSDGASNSPAAPLNPPVTIGGSVLNGGSERSNLPFVS